MKKLLANENFPLDSVFLLEKWGYDVYAISIKNFGISDEMVMQIAITEERTIMTFDRDYGELIFKKGYRPNAGVIYLRVEPIYAEYPAEVVKRILDNKDFTLENALTVVDEMQVRQRHY